MDAAIYKLMHAHGVNYTVAPAECICILVQICCVNISYFVH